MVYNWVCFTCGKTIYTTNKFAVGGMCFKCEEIPRKVVKDDSRDGMQS